MLDTWSLDCGAALRTPWAAGTPPSVRGKCIIVGRCIFGVRSSRNTEKACAALQRRGTPMAREGVIGTLVARGGRKVHVDACISEGDWSELPRISYMMVLRNV